MRHLYDRPHLNRDRDHRRALWNNLTSALVLHKRIITTLAKAKHARRFVERVITLARRGDLHARRLAAARVQHKEAVKILFEELGPLYKNRDGGYTRIIHLPPRTSDTAPMAILELVGFEHLPVSQPKSGKSKEEKSKEEKKESASKGKRSPKRSEKKPSSKTQSKES
ncbi:MAG: 50S ribosomal protein L17 [bacterium]